jgi:hypothetical protein
VSADDYLEQAEISNAEYEEAKRVERWHATYNAAVTGLRAWSSAGTDYLNAEAVHREALASANLAHGKLVP